MLHRAAQMTPVQPPDDLPSLSSGQDHGASSLFPSASQAQLYNCQEEPVQLKDQGPDVSQANLPHVQSSFLQLHRKSQEKVSSSSLPNLYNACIKNAQYKADQFAKLSNFAYTEQIKPENLNLALFAYGSLKHLLFLSDGTLPEV